MKIATVLGTRPEIIRLSLIVAALDRHVDHVLIHTGQNFDERLSDLFFRELCVRAPDRHLGVTAPTFGAQAAQIFERIEKIFVADRPDRLLILGDTNSALAAVIAKRLGIPVFHMEAGNRCWDDRVPEEVNRRIVDHSSDVLMPNTERSRDNLLREGIPSRRIFVTGNPIGEIIHGRRDAIDSSPILADLGLAPDGYFLVTLHRAENTDVPARVEVFLEALAAVAAEYGKPVIVSTHPRLRSRLEGRPAESRSDLRFLSPFGFVDFVRLERHAFCVLTDSGTVQEECAILGIPSVTLRDVTERPETLECGANLLAGCDVGRIVRGVRVARERAGQWIAPPEYRVPNVCDTVVRLVTGYHHALPGGLS